MNLTLTQYVDAAPDVVATRLADAIGRGLTAAADRLNQPTEEIMFDSRDGAVSVERGLDVLAGTQVRVSGEPRLATVEVIVPWSSDDRDGRKFRAANIFAHTIGREVRPAA